MFSTPFPRKEAQLAGTVKPEPIRPRVVVRHGYARINSAPRHAKFQQIPRFPAKLHPFSDAGVAPVAAPTTRTSP
jgi:hypothetical protein